MKHIVYILIIFILFSGCEDTNRYQPPYQINPSGNLSAGNRNSSQIIPAIFKNNNASAYDVDYYEGGNDWNETPSQKRNSDNRLVLVTSDIADKLQQLRSSTDELEDMNRLSFSLSGRFNLILPVMNNGPKISNEGAFVDRSQNTKTINFDTTDLGKLRTIIPNAPLGKESFIIVFQKDGEIIPLGFKKSFYSDSYILSTVDYGTERYLIGTQNGLPHLCIYMTQNILPNIIGTPFSALGGFHKRCGFSCQSYDRYCPIILSECIISHGYVSKRGAISYIKSQNPSANYQSLNTLIDLYIEEAVFEGVNHDIAIAQMLYATNYLRNNVSSFNYAGLSTVGTRGWDGRFPNMRTGVRAHIQHLKAYGSTQLPRNQIVDPRYHLIGGMKGKVKNISQLCELWSHNSNYKENLIKKLYCMYQFTDQ